MLDTISAALDDLKAGKCIIVVDDEDRENEGDLIASAELCSEEVINFMATEARGLICVSVTGDRARELDLPLMVNDNTALHGTRFTISVDYVHGTASGISVADRTATVRAMADPGTKPAPAVSSRRWPCRLPLRIATRSSVSPSLSIQPIGAA